MVATPVAEMAVVAVVDADEYEWDGVKRRAEARMAIFDELPPEARAVVHEKNATRAQMLMLLTRLRQAKAAKPPPEGRLYRKRR